MNAQIQARPELQVYEAALPYLLTQHYRQFVVIHGDKLEQFFDTYDAAIDWAYNQFGLEPFFVKEVSEEENVAHFIRDLGPCTR
jgi:hypothetical protein